MPTLDRFNSPHLTTVAMTAFLTAIYIPLNFIIEKITRLDQGQYFQKILSVQSSLGAPIIIVSLLLVAIGLAYFSKNITHWDALQCGRQLKIFITTLTLIIAWTIGTLAYNYYFHQGYYFDRILLLILALLTIWRPIFILPFLLLAYVFLWQLAEPNIGAQSIFIHKFHVLRILTIFAAFYSIYLITGYKKIVPFFVLVACYIGTSYFAAALTKALIPGWLSSEQLHLMIVNAYSVGWLSFLSVAQIESWVKLLQSFDSILRWGVILIQFSCVLLLYKRWSILALLSILTIFHLGIFLFNGYFFWTWIIVNLSFLSLFIAAERTTQSFSKSLFNPAIFLLSITLIVSGTFWARPAKLGWLDTPLNYQCDIKVKSMGVEDIHLHPSFFAPYNEALMFSNCHAFDQNRRLVHVWGVTKNKNMLMQLIEAKNAKDVFKLEKGNLDSSIALIESAKTEPQLRYQNLIERYLRGKQSETPKGAALKSWLLKLHPPSQFIAHAGNPLNKPTDKSSINKISHWILEEKTSWYDGEAYQVIREQKLAEISLAKP